MGTTMSGRVPQVTCGTMRDASMSIVAIEVRTWVGHECTPARHGRGPGLARRGLRPALDVVDGCVVDGDDTRAAAGFDAHVAERHALFHRQRGDGVAGELDRETGAAGAGDLADDGEREVLGGHAGGFSAREADVHRLWLHQRQALRGQHVFDLGRADAEGQCAERPVRGRVAVTADDRHAGLRQALLGTDDVHDALGRRVEVVQA